MNQNNQRLNEGKPAVIVVTVVSMGRMILAFVLGIFLSSAYECPLVREASVEGFNAFTQNQTYQNPYRTQGRAFDVLFYDMLWFFIIFFNAGMFIAIVAILSFIRESFHRIETKMFIGFIGAGLLLFLTDYLGVNSLASIGSMIGSEIGYYLGFIDACLKNHSSIETCHSSFEKTHHRNNSVPITPWPYSYGGMKKFGPEIFIDDLNCNVSEKMARYEFLRNIYSVITVVFFLIAYVCNLVGAAEEMQLERPALRPIADYLNGAGNPLSEDEKNLHDTYANQVDDHEHPEWLENGLVLYQDPVLVQFSYTDARGAHAVSRYYEDAYLRGYWNSFLTRTRGALTGVWFRDPYTQVSINEATTDLVVRHDSEMQTAIVNHLGVLQRAAAASREATDEGLRHRPVGATARILNMPLIRTADSEAALDAVA